MADKFVRNITDTNTGGNKLNKNNEPTEPLYTNIQNDILSDDEDVYIRNQNEYVCLTDNVKEVETTSNIIGTENTDKNTVELQPQVATKTDAETGTSNGKIMTPLQTKNAIEYNNVNVIPDLVKTHETETEITSKSDNLKVTKTSKNNFELEVDQSDDVDLSDYTKNDDFEEHVNNKSNPHKVTKAQVGLSSVVNKNVYEYTSGLSISALNNLFYRGDNLKISMSGRIMSRFFVWYLSHAYSDNLTIDFQNDSQFEYTTADIDILLLNETDDDLFISHITTNNATSDETIIKYIGNKDISIPKQSSLMINVKTLKGYFIVTSLQTNSLITQNIQE